MVQGGCGTVADDQRSEVDGDGHPQSGFSRGALQEGNQRRPRKESSFRARDSTPSHFAWTQLTTKGAENASLSRERKRPSSDCRPSRRCHRQSRRIGQPSSMRIFAKNEEFRRIVVQRRQKGVPSLCLWASV